jgi:hypothetical protein
VGTLRNPFVSPDGRQMVIPALGADGRIRLWLRALDSDQMQPIFQTEGATTPFWSPEGKSIAFYQSGFLKRIELAGGAPQTICAVGGGAGGGSWNTGGVIVFGSIPGPLYSVSAQGGTPRAVTQLDGASGEVSHYLPNFLPDQRHFLYTAFDGKQGRPKIGSLDGKVNLALLGTGCPFRFAPPGYVLFGREGSIMAQRFSAARLQLEGEPVRVAEPVEPLQGSPPGSMGIPVQRLGERRIGMADRRAASAVPVGLAGRIRR